MKRSYWQCVLALALCTLVPVMAAQAKARVTRPLKMQAQTQQVWQLDTNGVPVQMLSAGGWGVATHCGLFYTAPSGAPAPDGFMAGFMKSANGDQILFIWPLTDVTRVTITGGTGRFAAATGEFAITLLSQKVSVDPVAGMMTIDLTWTASGTITY